MLAARDQENLVHGHQAAGAAKALNQGSRQLAPKTPSNKTSKTPFKVPLNDQNGIVPFGGLKTAGKTMVKGNENLPLANKPLGLTGKNAFTTPMGMAFDTWGHANLSMMTFADDEQDHAIGLPLA